MSFSTLYRFWESAFIDDKTMWWDTLLCIDQFTGKFGNHIYLHFSPIQMKSKNLRLLVHILFHIIWCQDLLAELILKSSLIYWTFSTLADSHLKLYDFSDHFIFLVNFSAKIFHSAPK